MHVPTGVWLKSLGAKKEGPEYIQRSIVGILIGKCGMEEAIAEKAVVLNANKTGWAVELPRIRSLFFPDAVTKQAVAEEFIRIIEAFGGHV